MEYLEYAGKGRDNIGRNVFVVMCGEQEVDMCMGEEGYALVFPLHDWKL